MNKICVYAIARNESKFVEKWLSSMSEADYIVVLDTGSNDGTYDMLRKDSRVTRCRQKIITPWRFDTARNLSMELVPDDANILVCTDLDEVFDTGWAETLRARWNPQEHVRGWYQYAWSHDAGGNPNRVFTYDKIHDKNWYWKYQVHECLVSDIYDSAYTEEHSLHLNDDVYLHHYPDMNKPRDSYLNLLIERTREYPEDTDGKIYLAHEMHYRGLYQPSIAMLEVIIPIIERNYNTIELASCFLFLGDNYRCLGDKNKAISNYNRAIEIDRTYREPYLAIAEIMNENGLYHMAVGYVDEAIKQSYRHYTWLERDTSWKEQVYDILSVSYYYIGEIKASYQNAVLAHEINPANERIASNYHMIEKMSEKVGTTL
jgi:tetratricopeptide (TPR) repeat protein